MHVYVHVRTLNNKFDQSEDIYTNYQVIFPESLQVQYYEQVIHRLYLVGYIFWWLFGSHFHLLIRIFLFALNIWANSFIAFQRLSRFGIRLFIDVLALFESAINYKWGKAYIEMEETNVLGVL